jgi:hypothetical protein
VRRCLYCDFAVHVSRKGDLASWRDALAGELRAIDAEGLFALEESLDTLYVGGGTPSLLGGEAMEALAVVLGRRRLAAPDLEWTAEANPESLTPELASAWRRAGLNRLSIGIQTFNADALRWMGRLHGAEGADQAVDVARAAGFENLSVDLIFGLPGRLGRSWRQDLERARRSDERFAKGRKNRSTRSSTATSTCSRRSCSSPQDMSITRFRTSLSPVGDPATTPRIGTAARTSGSGTALTASPIPCDGGISVTGRRTRRARAPAPCQRMIARRSTTTVAGSNACGLGSALGRVYRSLR